MIGGRTRTQLVRVGRRSSRERVVVGICYIYIYGVASKGERRVSGGLAARALWYILEVAVGVRRMNGCVCTRSPHSGSLT